MTGDTSRAGADYSPTNSSLNCTGFVANGNDLVYSFTAATAGTYVVTLTPSGFDGSLYVLDQCPSPTSAIASCLGGADHPGAGTAEVVTLTLAANTSIYIVVDGFSGTDLGSFTLGVTNTPVSNNDLCDAPVVALTLGTPVSGDTSHAHDDYSPPQAGANCTGFEEHGFDVAYSFTPPLSGRYQFSLTRLGTAYDAAMYLLDHCPSTGTAITSCVGASDVPGAGAGESFGANLVANTTYTLIVDGFNTNAGGAFTVQVDSATQPPLNDVCSGAIALTQGVAVTGNTASATNDYSPSQSSLGCTNFAETGPDLVYVFNPPASGRYRMTMAQTTPGFDAALYVLDACPTSSVVSSCLGGSDKSGNLTPEVVSLNLTLNTPVYLVVDGYQNGAGPFSLEVDASPTPSNDTCSAPLPLATNTTVSVDTTGASDDLHPASTLPGCGATSGAGQDVVYSFTPSSTGSYTFRLSDPSTSPRASLYVLDACPGSNAALTSCVGGTALDVDPQGTLTLHLTANQTYFVVVDASVSGVGGQYSLTVAPTATPPANDDCSVGTALAIGTVFSGDSSQAASDYGFGSNTCGSIGAADGQDVVYSFTPPAPGQYRVTVSGASFTPILYALSTCPASNEDLPGCLAGSGGGFSSSTAAITVSIADRQTAYFVVDSDSTGGTFHIEVAEVVAPTNDTCQTATVINAGDTATGDSSSANNDYNPGTSCAPLHSPGPDVVYAFTAPATKTYTVSVTPDANFDPVLYVETSCPFTDAQTCPAGKDQGSRGGVETLSFSATQGVTYFLVVDGYNTSSGSFSLAVSN